MAGFTIYITPIVTGSDLTHSGTSWQVAKDSNFTNLVVNKSNDTNNLLNLRVDLPLTKDDKYYVRHKLHFNNNSKQTAWSRPSIITKDSDGFSFNNTVINTPRISLNVSPNNTPLGGFIIKGSEFNMFIGVGEHKSTDWNIEDSEGNLVFERTNDKSNLTEYRIPQNTLHPGKMYLIKVRYRSTTNSYSNYGKLPIITNRDLISTEEGLLVPEDSYLLSRVKYLEEQLKESLNKLVGCTIYNSL